GMIRLTGGRFRMGRTPAELDVECALLGASCRRELLDREQPARDVTLSPFYLDEREATNEEVARWLSSIKPSIEMRVDEERETPRWVVLDGRRLLDLLPPHAGIELDAEGGFRARSGEERKPAVQLTWDGASLYCKSRGKRLPTEAEWEYAARGQTARRFPWGDQEPDCAGVVWGRDVGKPCAAAGDPGPLPVGTARLDHTPEGVRDLGGNVMEWVQDQFRQPYYPRCGTCVDPVVDEPTPLAEDVRVLRGGSWAQGMHIGRATMRGRWNRSEVMQNAGVRCASH
ncbi:MAG TPA: SUMF1/EgtB/PvdO family nonheme iron enzyme, partial [Kofleriaceae bacterium]|nr:SUMF1/EgtB/PvdO family nonheme iron enzyme [Kofleriaceae bacterium]